MVILRYVGIALPALLVLTSTMHEQFNLDGKYAALLVASSRILREIYRFRTKVGFHRLLTPSHPFSRFHLFLTPSHAFFPRFRTKVSPYDVKSILNALTVNEDGEAVVVPPALVSKVREASTAFLAVHSSFLALHLT